MKNILLITLSLYQNIFVYFLKNILGVNSCCRFEVTCSEYSKNVIKEHGAFRGVSLSIQRILKCQPFYNNATAF